MPEPWNRIECEAIAADYFAMLAKEISAEDYISKDTSPRRVCDEAGARTPTGVGPKRFSW